MDAFELLKEDHRKVADLFEKIDETTEKAEKTREELFARVKRELDAHAHVEETLLYPELRKAEETRELTLEAVEEHKVVKELLAELDRLKKGTEQWKAKFTVLKENVEHHVEEEEDELFPDAKKVLDAERRDVLGKTMAEEKARFLERADARTSRKSA
jgi:hemerythrin superfamily protein